ncbi:MAG: amidase [Myxococcales bacterium]|nr:amidase [Myxococcales bacterium]
MAYDLKPIKAPRAAGLLLRGFVVAVENAATGALLADKLLGDAGILALREREVHTPLAAAHPVLDHGLPRAATGRPPVDLGALGDRLPAPPARGTQEGVLDFARAYRDKRTDPRAVAERALAIVAETEARSPALRLFIAQDKDDLLRQADASAARHAAGKSLGPLDGVPVAVKDELDQAGYPTTVGTRFLGTTPATADAEVVARLRRAGALLVGKANMHEIGLGVTGLNPHHGAARNPHDPARATGGSSSGPAAAVAAGVCPLAVGADGGGSIRIPAALCGVFGLKATFGRVSEHGAAELCWSVGHVGPIAGSARDLALGYAAMAGLDEKDPQSLWQPEVDLDGLERPDLAGVRLGIYRPWFEDAEPDVVARTRALVDALCAAGATLVDVELPELETLRAVHLVTIVGEMAAAHAGHYARHRTDYGLDTRLNLALGRRFQAYDYVHAQRHRARLGRLYAEAFAPIDALVTPATGCTAPLLPADALETGESNLPVTERIMRFAALANLTGQPAVSVPAGYDATGLPVGLQLVGKPWQEALLLRLAFACEGLVERHEPAVHHRYLG